MALHMKKTHNILQGYLLIAPLLLGCLLFYAIPFILVIQYSLSTGSGDALYFINFINYQDVTTNGMFTLAFGNTMRFLAAALPLIMVLAYAIALLMQKHANKHKLLKSVFLFPYIMPVVGAVILVELLFANSGLVPSIANALGLPLVDWLGGPAAFGVVLLLYLWKNTGYVAHERWRQHCAPWRNRGNFTLCQPALVPAAAGADHGPVVLRPRFRPGFPSPGALWGAV